jgi:glycosyltransferase involved in cell wall biosynthesis
VFFGLECLVDFLAEPGACGFEVVHGEGVLGFGAGVEEGADVGVVDAEDGVVSGAVFVGRLVAQKGVTDLLAALADLRRRGSAIPLTVVGDGPERQALERRAVLLGLGKSVRFVGAVSPERVSGLLADQRVAVLPATGEGLGLVLAEALAAGVPVVAYESGGIADLLVDREAGELVRPGDVKGLADAMHRVVSDQRYLDAAARAGRILAARLAPSRVAEQFESVYQSACALFTG